jgi:flagellar motor switch protein FliN/FliY
MTTEQALLKLAEKTGEAVEKVLLELCEPVERGEVSLSPAGGNPLESIPFPAVAAKVAYIDGASGGNVFVTTRLGAHRLVAAMTGAEGADEDGELTELELAAVGDAMNRMMAAAAGATSAVLGQDIEIGAPATHALTSLDDGHELTEGGAFATVVPFTIGGESSRLIQLVPNAFVVRMTRALSDLEAELLGDAGHSPGGQSGFSAEAIRHVAVRVSAELGTVRMPLARAVGLAPGSVVELDRAADDPVDLYVNGRRFGKGRLVLIDDEWAVRLEEITAPGYDGEREDEEIGAG